MNLKLRAVSVEDAEWITEAINTHEVAEPDLFLHPRTEHVCLITAILEFRNRYGYRKVVIEIPGTSFLTGVLQKSGFRKIGAWKGYYFIDGYYVDALSYAYPQ